MKVQAIQALPKPENKKAVERLLEFVKYLSRFLPNLAEVVAPLLKLTEKAILFYWESQQQLAFDQVKQLVTSAPILKFYGVQDEVTLQCDTSEKEFGSSVIAERPASCLCIQGIKQGRTNVCTDRKGMSGNTLCQ